MILRRKTLSTAIRLACSGAVATGIAFSGMSSAEEAVKLEKEQVTGSHIKKIDLEGAQPVIRIEREAIEASGFTNVGDLLQSLPQAGSAVNTTFNNGGDGSTRVDLRNLGAARTLVLIDGRRWVSSGDNSTLAGNSIDLNSIPMSIVERIEVLKDGASAIYGSDAIAGVVNIITRKDFDGAQINIYGGTSEQGDGDKYSGDVTFGVSGDKGNVVFNASYINTDPIWAGDRKISSVPTYGTGNTRGSSGTPQGRFFINPSDATDPSDSDYLWNVTTPPGSGGIRSLDDPNIIPFTNDERYNYAPENYLVTPQERTSFFTAGQYNVTSDIVLDAKMLFNRRESAQVLAPMPLFFGTWIDSGDGNDLFGIGRLNPFNPFGYDIQGDDIQMIARRMIEGGNREFNQTEDTYTIQLGLSGTVDVFNGWDWNAHYSYSEVTNNETVKGRLNKSKIRESLGNECLSDPSCVPLDLFGGEGSITSEMMDYITYTEKNSSGDKQTDFTLNFSSPDVYELPAGSLGLAFGYEYRKSEAYNTPDYIISSGQSTGSRVFPTSGEYDVNELYAEAAIPLLDGLDWVESLEADIAVRYSDYSSFGSTTNGKIGLSWRPTNALLFRSTWSEGFRAPSIGQMFGGGGDNYPELTDPCNGGGAGKPGCVGVPDDYEQFNTQIRITELANPDLEPEESTNWTAGVVWDVSDDLTISLDWYDIEIDNTITKAGAQTILDVCAESGVVLCGQIDRNEDGFITDLRNSGINAGGTKVEGIDFSLLYSLATDYGDFKFTWDTAYTIDYTDIFVDPLTGARADVDRVGRNTGDTAYPRIKSNLAIDWTKNDWAVHWAVRYIGEQTESCSDFLDDTPNSLTNLGLCSDPNFDDNEKSENEIDATFYHDMQVSYYTDIFFDSRITFGINNVFDQDPPVSYTAFANSFDASIYDPYGRFYYLRWTTNF